MDYIQTIESLSQDDRHKTSAPQILDHLENARIHSRCTVLQEKACKDAKAKSIEMIGAFYSN